MESTLAFQEIEHDFLHYMLQYGGIARKTSYDYVSRMRFLSQFYVLDANITDEYVEYIINEEKKCMPGMLATMNNGLIRSMDYYYNLISTNSSTVVISRSICKETSLVADYLKKTTGNHWA